MLQILSLPWWDIGAWPGGLTSIVDLSPVNPGSGFPGRMTQLLPCLHYGAGGGGSMGQMVRICIGVPGRDICRS